MIQRKHRSQWKFTKVRYRLATKTEWELAAAGKLDLNIYPYGIERKKEEIWDYIFYRWPKYDQPEFRSRLYTFEVQSLLPNAYGAYNLTGHVSEMIAEKGLAKGGHFNSPLDSCAVQLDHRYTKPEAWLGFRCICEIVE